MTEEEYKQCVERATERYHGPWGGYYSLDQLIAEEIKEATTPKRYEWEE